MVDELSSAAPKAFSVGLLLFPNLTQLDLTGPHEIFVRAPGTTVHLIWKSLDPVTALGGMAITPTTTFETCPAFDLICVPGGPGQVDLMADDAVLAFLRAKAAVCRFVTSVCTGSLVLAAVGLLRGYRATCHWTSIDQLALLGVTPVPERIVRDRNRITGAGVTSGIDFALFTVAEIFGAPVAEYIQLSLEYDPEPPFASGSPRQATAELVADALEKAGTLLERRLAATKRAAEKLGRLSK